MLLTYLGSSLVILIYSLLIGLGLTKFFKKSLFMFPILFSIFLGGLSFVLTLSNLQLWFLYLIPLLFLLKSAYEKLKELKSDERKILMFFIFQFFLYAIIQLFVVYYPLGSDWYLNYESSLEISNNNFQLPAGRTPLFNLIEGSFLTLINKEFYIAQIVTVLLGSMMIFPFYLLSKMILKPRFLTIALLFLIFNPFVIENTLYNFSKMLAAIFTLYFILYLLKNNNHSIILSGVLAFLTHEMTLLFTLPIYLVQIYRKRSQRLVLTKCFFIFFVIVAIIFILKSIFITNVGELGRTYFLYYPIAVNGWEQLEGKTSEQIFADFLTKPFYYHIGVRIVNLMNTGLPTIPVLKFVNEFISLPSISLHRVINIGLVPWLYYYTHSIPGALTSLVYIFSLISMYKNRNNMLVWFIVISILSSVFVFGWITPGVAKVNLQATIPLMTLFAVKYLSNKDKKLIWLVFCVMLIEGLIFSYTYNNFIPVSIQNAIDKGYTSMLQTKLINGLL